MNNNVEGIFNKLNDRLDDIEKLLKMLIVNELVDETEQIIAPIEMVISPELQIFLNRFAMKCFGFNTINNVQVFVIEVPEGTKLKISDFCLLHSEIIAYYPERVPLFGFKTMNGMQRKRFMQEKISFGVSGKEFHVFNTLKRK